MFYTHSPRREWVGIYFFLYGLPVDATRRSSTFVKCQYFHSPHQFSRCFIEMELLPLLCVSNGGRNLRGIMARNVLIFSWRKKGCEFMQELTLVICSYKRVKSRYFFFLPLVHHFDTEINTKGPSKIRLEPDSTHAKI